MATLVAKKNPQSRTDAGDAVLAAAKSAHVAPVKKRLAAFASVHKEYLAAEAKVGAAEAAFRKQQQNVGELDHGQDDAIDRLATALVSDGAPRTRPFAALGFDAPTTLQKLGDAKEARTIRALGARVRKSKGASKSTLAACAAAEKAAAAVLAAVAPLSKLAAAHHAAIVARDAIGLRWEKAFGALKRGARAAEDDGAVGLFEEMFAASAPRRSRTRVKPVDGATAPAAPAATGG